MKCWNIGKIGLNVYSEISTAGKLKKKLMENELWTMELKRQTACKKALAFTHEMELCFRYVCSDYGLQYSVKVEVIKTFMVLSHCNSGDSGSTVMKPVKMKPWEKNKNLSKPNTFAVHLHQNLYILNLCNWGKNWYDFDKFHCIYSTCKKELKNVNVIKK